MESLAAFRRGNPFACDLFNSAREVWHVPAATQRRLSRSGYRFLQESPSRQRRIWRQVWLAAPVMEARLQCLWPLLDMPVAERMALWPEIQWYCACIENWCESDYLSSLVADALEYAPVAVQPVLERWNRHRDPWLRRQSLVGLFYYQRLRKRQPPCDLVRAQLQPHLAAPEHYVQKAVGWTLREAWQVYPRALQPWVESRLGDLGAGAFSTLLEKVPAPLAREWKSSRQRARQRRR